jgi:ribosomal protection tetracycline resistance protein
VKTLNLGILAHVDAGKTSLTERLLYAAGVIDAIGRVDDGNTQTDSMALERQRGITIKSAVVSFLIDDLTVNIIDTPGHPDFIAEVDRVLSVLDGAVLVVSAVEGVQSQTRLLMRALRRLRIPALIFVNKIDRAGAQYERTLHGISEKLTSDVISMGDPRRFGTRHADFISAGDVDVAFHARLIELLARRDDALLAAYTDDVGVSVRGLRRILGAQTRKALVYPVFFGSAITGAGVDALTTGISELLPGDRGESHAPMSGTVFKVERGRAGEKIAYVRMFSGTVRTRDRVRVGASGESKVTGIKVFEGGSAVTRRSLAAGQIGKLLGIGDVQIGDIIGEMVGLPRAMRPHQHHFAPPSLETVVVPRHSNDKQSLHVALTQLAEQDPLINLRQDDTRQELSLSLYGEVQKEVIEATLAHDFGVAVTFRETTTICIERPIGRGTAVEAIGMEPNPFLATVGLCIEPAAVGSGVTFQIEAEMGSMPLAFFRVVEDTVRETLQQGICGWEVTDCTVAMTHSGYLGKHGLGHQAFNKSMSSTGEDFRNVTPLVLINALRQARTQVYEPIHRFRAEIPAYSLGSVMALLAQARAVSQPSATRDSLCLIDGEIPANRVHELRRALPRVTRGEGVLESDFDHYRPVCGAPPTRARSDHNPLDRKEYLLHVLRRV